MNDEDFGPALDTLPPEDPARRRPLLGCWYRRLAGKDWKEVKPAYKIASKSYNDLGPAWTETSVFCRKK